MGKIMGFVVIIITLTLSPSIYTANSAILSWTTSIVEGTVTLSDFIGLSAIAGFGGFIIILGLLVSGGLFTLAGVKGQLAGAAWKDILMVIGSVIVVIVTLTMFTSILDSVDSLLAAAIDAGDSIGSVLFGIIPILIYVGIVAAAGWTQVSTYRRLRKGGKSATSKSAAAYA
jgi:hypothetical protein